jgi:hypothetical protein
VIGVATSEAGPVHRVWNVLSGLRGKWSGQLWWASEACTCLRRIMAEFPRSGFPYLFELTIEHVL